MGNVIAIYGSKSLSVYLLFLQSLWSRSVYWCLACMWGFSISLSFLWLMLLVLVCPSVYRLQIGRFRQGNGGIGQMCQILHFRMCSIMCWVLWWALQLLYGGPSNLWHWYKGICRFDKELWVHRQQDQGSPRSRNRKLALKINGNIWALICQPFYTIYQYYWNLI